MQHDISFLHTDQIHISTFASLMDKYAPHLSVRHEVETELLKRARNEGLGKQLKARIHNAMQSAASSGAKVVVCTCSSIGAAAELAGNERSFTAMRIDRPMTIQALKIGRRILVTATVASTLTPTIDLVRDSAAKLNIEDDTFQIEPLLIEHAWPFFEAGDNARYFRTIQRSLSNSWLNYDVIVLAQASMAAVHSLCDDIKVPLLSSPASGVQAAIKTFDQSNN